MNDHAHQLPSSEQELLDEVCEGRPRRVSPAPPIELVERFARDKPDATAVHYGGERLTYSELNRRANRLAHWLIARRMGRERRIVVRVEPSFDVVVVLLAILKTGAAYVPVDPAYPAAHLRAILDDTGAELMLETTRREAREATGTESFGLDELEDALGGFSGENLSHPVDTAATAYVFYTSGTTGAPKGVMASYANLASYIAAARERYDFTSADVMPAIARFGFSISLFELLTPLSAGGTLRILDRADVLDPAKLADILRTVTVFHAGPSLLRPVLDHIRARFDDVSAFDGVRHASSGGDLIAPELLEWAKDVFRNAQVFVIYGCSEIACMGCTYEVPRDRSIKRTYVGRPFDGMSVRVVDESLNRVALTEVGEICFSGDGVVEGYLNHAELTRARFIDVEGRRFYRTGDMGRITEEGFLEILGRTDFQAKIRGMRVELGEVEHHLRRAPKVKEGVVMPRDGADGEKVLVAYVVLQDSGTSRADGEPSCAAAIRRHMVEHLPDYMVPAIYLELPRLPLNHNLKVDRRALPAPGRMRLSSARGRPPETSTERSLASIWKRLLHVDEVCLDDNFFELGGHSLLAVSLMVDAQHELGVVLDGMEILRESLEVLARLCDARLGKPAPVRPRSAGGKTAARVELLHFGPGESLYGVLTAAQDGAAAHAVLVCPPLGQEKARAHFVLQSFARRLAAGGVPSLQFDYFGTGDSLGASFEADCTRWQDDIAAALAELVRRTRCERVTAVGVRFGAALLSEVAPRLAVDRLVFWDPVTDGAEHVRAMTRMQRDYLAGAEHFSFRKRARPHTTELLGMTYSARALEQMRAMTLRPSAHTEKWLATSGAAAWTVPGNGAGSRLERHDVDCSWEALHRLEDMLPDVGIGARLAALCAEEP